MMGHRHGINLDGPCEFMKGLEQCCKPGQFRKGLDACLCDDCYNHVTGEIRRAVL